jgi:hypothetical protein
MCSLIPSKHRAWISLKVSISDHKGQEAASRICNFLSGGLSISKVEHLMKELVELYKTLRDFKLLPIHLNYC